MRRKKLWRMIPRSKQCSDNKKFNDTFSHSCIIAQNRRPGL
uniref:Uncharacterized protein n=1 Tax=Anguilla anguilla TaxID=7936 RepID=A0A0E9S8Q8_ANGAN